MYWLVPSEVCRIPLDRSLARRWSTFWRSLIKWSPLPSTMAPSPETRQPGSATQTSTNVSFPLANTSRDTLNIFVFYDKYWFFFILFMLSSIWRGKKVWPIHVFFRVWTLCDRHSNDPCRPPGSWWSVATSPAPLWSPPVTWPRFHPWDLDFKVREWSEFSFGLQKVGGLECAPLGCFSVLPRHKSWFGKRTHASSGPWGFWPY